MHGGYTARRDLASATRAPLRLQPADRPLAAAARLARAARRARAGVIGGRLYAAGGATNDRRTLRSMEIYDFARRRWRAGPRSKGRAATTWPASPPAASSTRSPAARAATATTRSAERYDPRAPPLAAAALDAQARAAASPRRRSAAAGSWCSAARSRPARSARSSSTTRGGAAGARCRTCARRATGSAACRSGNRVYAIEGGPQPGLLLLERDRVPRRAVDPVFPLKDDIPTRRFPVLTVALIAINVVDVLRLPGRLLRTTRSSTSRVVEYGAIPYEITHPGDHCDVPTPAGAWPARGRRG